MSTVSSLNNPVLNEEEELSHLISQIRLGSKSLSKATASPPLSWTRSLRDDRRRRPPPVSQLFAPVTSPKQIAAVPPPAQDTVISPPLGSNPPVVRFATHSRQSSDDSLEYVDARSHQSSGYGDSSFDNTVASITNKDLRSFGDDGPESRHEGE